MKTREFRTRLLAAVCVLLAANPGLGQTFHKDLKYPELGELKIPEIERVELENGMILFLAEDHELPLISLSGRIGVGSVYDPEDKIELAGITGHMMRTGGTTSMSGDEIDEELERMAASLGISIGRTSGSISMGVLKEDVDKGLSILADVLMHPAFRKDKLDLAKILLRSAIARRNDHARSISSREFNKLIYGASSPYARHFEYATIDAIGREDLIAFHREFFHPENVMMAVTGDFESKEMVGKIAEAFSEWKPGLFQHREIPEVKYTFDSSVNLIEKDDINQTCLRMGHIGGVSSDPDYPELIVMNYILGVGWTSRIFANIRSRMGLAYSAYAWYGTNYDYPGTFYVDCQTKAESTMTALNAMRAEVQRITEELVTDEELDQAKKRYLNSFVFNFDSTSKIVGRVMTYEYYGYPRDFLQKEREGIEKVTKEDVLRVAGKHLRPDRLRILAVGNPQKFDQPLSTLGEVRTIDITIPGSEEKRP